MIQENFAKRCRELRERTGLSQQDFALKIDMDRTYYSRIEKGQTNASLIAIAKIAGGFGLSLGELFSGVDGVSSPKKDI